MGNSQSSSGGSSSRSNHEYNYAQHLNLPTLNLPTVTQPSFTPMPTPKFEFKPFENRFNVNTHSPNFTMPSSFSAPSFEMPKFNVPKFEPPQFEMPKFNLPEFEPLKFEMPKFAPTVCTKPESINGSEGIIQPTTSTPRSLNFDFKPFQDRFDKHSMFTYIHPPGTTTNSSTSSSSGIEPSEGILSVLGKAAIDGDPKAQQEMRSRLPKIAEAFDTFNTVTEKYNTRTSAVGAVKVAVGMGQALAAEALAGTGVGILAAIPILAKASDNITAGIKTIVNGEDTPTVVEQAARNAGLGDTAAIGLDMASDIVVGVPAALEVTAVKEKLFSKWNLPKFGSSTKEVSNAAVATEEVINTAKATSSAKPLTLHYDSKMAEAAKVSFSKPRVDTSRLSNTNSSLSSSISSSSSAPLSKETQRLLASTSNNRVTILAEALSKSETKELISSGKLNLPKPQLDKIMTTVNKASRTNANITIKQVNKNGNIKVIVERPGYNGFQRFSSEINVSGDRNIVVQTAYDRQGNIVHQKPGQPKNNIFDVKLYKPKYTSASKSRP